MRLLLLVLLLAGCTVIPYQREYDAYRDLIQSQVNGGQLTIQQGNYALAQKENELRLRSGAVMNSGIMNAYPGFGMAIQGAQKVPYGTTCVQTGSFISCR